MLVHVLSNILFAITAKVSLNFHGQSYWFGNDRSHANTTAWAGSFRDTVAAYVHYNDNGTIAPVVIDGSGIGQYDARHSIEAETFFAIDGAAEKRELRGDGGGFQVALHAGSSLSFPHVRLASRTDSSTVTTITLRVANGRTTRGSTGIRVYSGRCSG